MSSAQPVLRHAVREKEEEPELNKKVFPPHRAAPRAEHEAFYELHFHRALLFHCKFWGLFTCLILFHLER